MSRCKNLKKVLFETIKRGATEISEDVKQLKIGDIVYISGEAFTCRSRLQKYIFDEGNVLPFSTEGRNVLIHNGPIIVK